MWNILISDDEIIERMVSKKILIDYYKELCTVYEASNGFEAIEIARQNPINIAIMDISMPELNGIDAAKEILNIIPDCMIIFLTAYEDFNYVREALVIHAIDYLLKPCPDDDLINAVDTAMQSYEKISAYNKVRFSSKVSIREASVSQGKKEEPGFDVLQIISYINCNYQKELTLHSVASKFGYSEVYFCKYFKQNFNVNFTTYITNLRINAAKKLLQDSSINIKTIGKQIGYPDSNYFTKVFKRIVGITPSEFRNNYCQ